jgi:alpha-tubulin suppressor-like RCC1 family protein
LVVPKLFTPHEWFLYPSGMLSAGGGTTCALHQQGFGTMYCWGRNDLGQWGNGTTSTNPAITAKGGLSNVSDAMQVSCGHDHTCVVDVLGRVECSGGNSFGQSGKSPSTAVMTPTTVFADSVAVVASGGAFSCAVKSDSTVWCWGINGNGQLGNGSGPSSFVPVQVPNINNAIDVATGFAHACVLRATGTVWCWGAADSYQLGPNAKILSGQPPVEIPGLTAWRIAAGRTHTCAMTLDDTVVCWGSGDAQLGRKTASGGDPNYAPVAGLGKAFAISAFEERTCALLAPDGIKCWSGFNVLFALKAYDIAVGDRHACALFPGGKPKCWGANEFGQLTDGTTTSSFTPVP